jgi:hypothetical protein
MRRDGDRASLQRTVCRCLYRSRPIDSPPKRGCQDTTVWLSTPDSASLKICTHREKPPDSPPCDHIIPSSPTPIIVPIILQCTRRTSPQHGDRASPQIPQFSRSEVSFCATVSKVSVKLRIKSDQISSSHDPKLEKHVMTHSRRSSVSNAFNISNSPGALPIVPFHPHLARSSINGWK